MPIYRAQCIFKVDSEEARDHMVINPVFHDSGIASDPSGLASDLADGLASWAVPSGVVPVKVKLYDLEGTKPVYPAAEEDHAWDQPAHTTTVPREIAVCLSFFSDHNRPRERGRLYIPLGLTTTGSNVPRNIPGGTQSKVAELVGLFTGLGALDVDWSVWSTVTKQSKPVKNWWIDNEWDIMRSRGMAGTQRLEGTTSE